MNGLKMILACARACVSVCHGHAHNCMLIGFWATLAHTQHISRANRVSKGLILVICKCVTNSSVLGTGISWETRVKHLD